MFWKLRLLLREIQAGASLPICAILQDIDVTFAWEHAFTDSEVTAWMQENMLRKSARPRAL